MTKKSTLRALVLSALSLLICVSMLIGTTFAWFTDSVTSGQNVIQSGNLDVELYYTYDAAVAADVDSAAWLPVEDDTNIFGYDNWEPGFTKVAYFKIANEGSLALKYQLSADVYTETAGVNQAGVEFLLSDYIKTAIVGVDATRDDILALNGTNLKATYAMGAGALAKDSEKVVGLAIWMPTTVGNEANHNGTNVPSITFGINLIATQEMSESDSFGTDYDVLATYPHVLIPGVVDSKVYNVTGNTIVDDNTARYDIGLFSNDVNGDDHAKQGSVEIPKEAIADDAETIEVVIKKLPVVDDTVPVNPAEEKAVTIDVSVTGIKEGNTAPIKVTANIGAGLGTIKLYHKNQQIDYISYNNSTGVLIFETTSFSPFTVVYDEEIPVPSNTDIPQAIVTNVSDTWANTTIPWGSGGGLSSLGEQQLDTVYKFKAPHNSETVRESAYKDWACDYYVRLESDTLDVLPEGSIALGGEYGSFGWLGFYNPEVPTNEDIPILGSVVANDWTYEMVVGLVEEFKCGVGVASEEAAELLAGSRFVVMLRLTEPETGKYVNVSTVTYDFATGNSVLENDTTLYTPVYSVQELMEAISRGENPVLQNNLELNDAIVVQ